MATAAAAVTAVGGVTNIISGMSQRAQAKSAIRNFRWQELTNPFDNLEVSTLGADRQMEAAARSEAQSVDALQAAGARGVIGGTGRVQAATNRVAQNVAANLDQQQRQIDQSRAQQDIRNQAIQEQRQQQQLAGYGQMLNQGNQMFMQGFGQLGNAFGAAGQTQWGQGLESNMFGSGGGTPVIG